MKLYYSKGACSLAVRILINELNLPCEFEAVNLKTKITEHNVDYYTINPKGSVPALVTEDDELLTENVVIHEYLAEQYKAAAYLPPISDFKRYRVLEWLNFVSTELHKPCASLFNPQMSALMKDEVFRPLLKNKLNFVDIALKNSKYLMQDDYTLPDGYLFVVLSWMPVLQVDLNEFVNLSRYFNEMQKRPAVHKSLKQEGLAD